MNPVPLAKSLALLATCCDPVRTTTLWGKNEASRWLSCAGVTPLLAVTSIWL